MRIPLFNFETRGVFFPIKYEGILFCLFIYAIFKSFHSCNRALSLQGLYILTASLLFYSIVRHYFSLYPYSGIKIFDSIQLIGLLISVYALIQYAGCDISYWKTYQGKVRVFSFIGNPNFLANFLILLIPAVFLKIKKGIYNFTAFFLMLLTLIVSASYAAISSIICSLVIWMILFSPISNRKKIILFLIILFCLIFLVSMFFNNFNFSGLLETKLRLRLFVWTNSFNMIKSNFLLGTGLSTFGHCFFFDQRHVLLNFLGPHDYQRNFEYAHFDLVQIFFETGFIGFVLAILFISSFISRARVNHNKSDPGIALMNRTLMISLTACFIHSLFSFPFRIPTSSIIILIYAAWLTRRELKVIPGGNKDNIESNKDNIESNKDNIESNKDNIESNKDVKNIRDNKDSSSYNMSYIINDTKTLCLDDAKILCFKKALFVSKMGLIKIFVIILSFFIIYTTAIFFISEVYFFRASRLFNHTGTENKEKISYNLDQSLKLNSFNSKAYALKARNMIYNNDFDKPEKLLIDSLRLRGNIKALTDLGTLYFLRKDYFAAIKVFQYALSLNFSNTLYKIYFNIAQCYSAINDYKNSEHFFNMALKRNPFSKDTLFSYGNILFKQKKYKKALIVWKDLIDKYPSDIETMYNIGVLHENTDHWAKAESCYRKVLKIDDAHYRALLNLGVVLYRQAEYKKAGILWNRIILLSNEKRNVPKQILEIVKRNIRALKKAGI
jgi:tetratricopeptide (TPR) repeat protein/O-antigen ligase